VNNTSNELTSTPSASYTYDNNGNTLTKSGGTMYGWDAENRLTSAVVPGTGTVTFKYDPFGRRIQKSGSGGTTNYLYDDANLLEEADSSGTVLARYTQGPGVDQPLAELRAGTTSYYQADGLGSISSLSNSTGGLANTYTYDSFGRPTASSGTLTNPYRYSGRELDAETSLYFYRDRYYDQYSGRFVSEDPARFEGGIALYEYVANDPTVFVDPSGDCPLDLNAFVNWLDNHAHAVSQGGCAKNIRLGLAAGGANPTDSPVPARDWGPYLVNNLGFSQVPQDPTYSPKVGDIAVFQPVSGSNPNGHIEAWDGTQWVSDYYKQGPPLPNGTHFYPNLGKYGPQPYQIYRCN
jgi:RHS repeat-associated protein